MSTDIKSQAPNFKLQINSNNQNPKRYDLEDRTLEFSKRLIRFCQTLSRNTINLNLINQGIRSGTSMGANYREANETETKKDFLYRTRICRKEGKETIYWLNLIQEANPAIKEQIAPLLQETGELVKIFAKIIENSRFRT